jgi:cell division septation protein DedD
MRIALVLVCCLVSSTLWEATAHALEPQRQRPGLTEKGRKILRDIQVSDEVNGPEPRAERSSTKGPVARSTSSPTPTPPPQNTATPTTQPTSTVPASTPNSEPKPVPEPGQTPNRNLAFLVSLVLLILVGLAMLVIMGKKIYGLARGG